MQAISKSFILKIKDISIFYGYNANKKILLTKKLIFSQKCDTIIKMELISFERGH